MNLKITGKGLKITDGIRSHLDYKINKIFHDSDENTSIHVLLRRATNNYILVVVNSDSRSSSNLHREEGGGSSKAS